MLFSLQIEVEMIIVVGTACGVSLETPVRLSFFPPLQLDPIAKVVKTGMP
jgi:hypothetical protein